QLHDHNRLADAGATERADLAAFRERTNQIDDFDSGFEDLDFCVLIGQFRRWAVNRIALGEFHGAAIIDGFAGDIEQTPEHAFANGHADRTAGIVHAHPALQTFGRRHGDRPDPAFAEMLLHLESELGRVAVDFVLDLERVINFRQRFRVRKFYVHYGTDDLNDVSFIHKSYVTTERHLRGRD